MRRYWDLSEDERAALERSEVDDLLAVELMERGVLRPKAPVPEAEVDVSVPLSTFFVVKGGDYASSTVLAFADSESAHAFAKLRPLEVRDDWQTRTKSAKPFANLTVAEEQIATEADVVARHAQLAQNAKARDRNEKARAQYEKELRVVEKETAAVIEDWGQCRARAYHLARVRETFAEYLTMAGGNRDIARGFLVKAYGSGDVSAALGEPPPETKTPPGPSLDGESPEQDIGF
jgi:hypothetical protein